ncbi:hypothetical protein WJ58_29655 [Burkholderia ubonensis]|nr:hypothetical protein WJ58_29655 [Burkholderia ubonensis]
MMFRYCVEKKGKLTRVESDGLRDLMLIIEIMLNDMRRTAANMTKAWRTALCRSQFARYPYRINRIVRSW